MMAQAEKVLSILAIDDDAADLKLLKMHIKGIEGWSAFEFYGFKDWESAEQQIESKGIDIIFVDYLLGADTGLEVVKKIRAQGDLRPIIVLTGHGDARIAAEITRAGADDYLSKMNLNSEALRRSISNAVAQYQLRNEKELLETQLVQAQKMEAVGRLAGGVAHDFNNMLGVILGNAEMLIEDMGPDSPYIQRVQEIFKAAERSSNLTRQLLAFARKQTIAPEILNLNNTLKSMLKMLQRLIGEDIELSWSLKDNLWPVKIDPSQVDQILANLCVNARDAINGVGRVTIETDNQIFNEEYCKNHAGATPGSYVKMALSDTGAGMDQETMDNLFEPFFTTKDVGQGSGLGLATVYGIVKQNDGFIDVDSQAGVGTTFKIFFPRHIEPITKSQRHLPDHPVQTGSETILVVEDESAILAMTKIMLERLGYRVLAAVTPDEAIQITKRLNEDEVQLLITDVVMPQMNGRQLAEKLSEKFQHLKCLYMSGYTADVIAHHGVKDEGVEFIDKPFSRQDLAAKVRDVLDGLNHS